MEGSWPPLQVLGFLPTLSLQALLLHPIFPVHLSQPLRFLFIFPTVFLAFQAPIHHGFTPRELSPLYNFILGVMCLYGCWKSVEWGIKGEEGVLDYTWIGFPEEEARLNLEDDKGKEAVKGNGVSKEKKVGTKVVEKKSEKRKSSSSRKVLDPANLRRIRQINADQDSPLDILVWTLHLMMSMRGIGWAFGPSPKNVATNYPSKPSQFFLSTFRTLFFTHLTLLACAIHLTTSSFHKVTFWSRFLSDYLSPLHIHMFSETLTGLSLGTAAYAGLNAGYLTAILLVFIPTTLINKIFPNLLPKFDSSQYPPTFQSPWLFTSVRQFWGSQWHAFFSRPFQELGYKPTIIILGDGILGKIGGVMAVFGMSAWLHEYALWVATKPLGFEEQPAFILRWGGSIYFLAQGLAIILETLFTTLTSRRPSGLLGWIWSFPFIAGLGSLVYLSWFSQGILVGIPEFNQWAWQRWVIPVGCFAPGWLWV